MHNNSVQHYKYLKRYLTLCAYPSQSQSLDKGNLRKWFWSNLVPKYNDYEHICFLNEPSKLEFVIFQKP